MSADSRQFAQWIRDGRQRLGVSQTGLSRLTGIGRARLHDVMAARGMLRPAEVQRLAVIFGAPPPRAPAP